MGALTQAIYIALLAVVARSILLWIAEVSIGKEIDNTDVIIVMVLAIIAALLPAYLVISKGWGK